MHRGTNWVRSHWRIISKVDAGRAPFKGTRNAALHDPLAASFNESQSSPLLDVLFHKKRSSGMCEAMTECTDYLMEKRLRHDLAE